MLWTDKVKKILKKYWKYDSLKEKQIQVINELLLGNDVIGLLPTGYGKSMCYILPALITKKVIFIISPLISLMDDQKNKLIKMNIPVASLNGNNRNRDIEYKEIIDGKIKIVYMTPEYLTENNGLELANILMENNMLGYLAIDESHCLSSWGHDFRPNYLKIKDFRELYPLIPILAVTATARERVVNEISNFLKLKNPKIIRANFDRPNLYLKCIEMPKEKKKLIPEWKIIKNYINKYSNEKIIVYINNRNDTEKISQAINLNISDCSSAYHAGLSKENREEIQNKFNEGTSKVIISTIAFGMGIDQVVKCVLIFGCPSSIEEYYQEIGRGGRDGLPCETVLYYKDFGKKKYMIKKENNNLVANKLDNLYKVKDYFEISTCRRRYILEYFGMNKNYFLSNSFTCNNCDNCKNNNLVDITEKVYEHLIENKPMIKEYKEHLYKYSKLLNIFIHWKKIINFNNYSLKDIPNNMLIKLPIQKIEDNFDKEDIFDKFNKYIL